MRDGGRERGKGNVWWGGGGGGGEVGVRIGREGRRGCVG